MGRATDSLSDRTGKADPWFYPPVPFILLQGFMVVESPTSVSQASDGLESGMVIPALKRHMMVALQPTVLDAFDTLSGDLLPGLSRIHRL